MKSFVISSISLMAFAILIVSCRTGGPASFTDAPLHGIVYDETRLPVAAVQIRIGDTPPFFTDINGRFTIPDVPRGTIEFSAVKTGYRPVSGEFRFDNRTHILYLSIESTSSIRQDIEVQLVAGDLTAATKLCDELLEIGGDDPINHYLAVVVFHLAGDTVRAMHGIEWLAAHGVATMPVQWLSEAVSACGDGEIR